jgi:hypothetical protein
MAAKPLVVLRPVSAGYQVTVEPPLPDGRDRTRTYSDKVSAWAYAQGLWTDHRLGCCDETDGHGGRERAKASERKRPFALK